MHEIGLEFSQDQCDESHEHVQGRRKPLKETENYSFQFIDCVHQAFNRAARSARKFAFAVPTSFVVPALPVTMASTSTPVDFGGRSLPEGRPGTEHAF